MCIFQIYTYIQVFLQEVYIHEIYTPAIEQSDRSEWSECTSHGTNGKSQDLHLWTYLFIIINNLMYM